MMIAGRFSTLLLALALLGQPAAVRGVSIFHSATLRAHGAGGAHIKPEATVHHDKPDGHEKEQASPKEHEKEHEEPEGATEEEMAYAYCLVSSVTVVMSLFYLVNWHRQEIRNSTWRALNMTVSIFCAVLIYGSMRKFFVAMLGVVHHTSHITLCVFLFALVYATFQFTLYSFMSLPAEAASTGVQAAGTVFAHITGFAALYLTAELQFTSAVRESTGLTTLVAVAMGLALTGLNLLANVVRERMAKADGKVDEQEDAWMDAVNDAENDVLSLSVGFGLMQSFRHFICGEAQGFEPDEAPEHIIQQEANALLLGSVIFAALVFVGTWLSSRLLQKENGLGPMVSRVIQCFPGIASMGMAWSMLFWGEWQIYVLGFEGVRIAGCLLVALSMTALSLVLVFGLDMVESFFSKYLDTGALHALVAALGLLVGFTWERCFDIALDKLSEVHGKLAWAAEHVLPIILLAVVLPAWAKYVFPKAVEA